MNQQMPQLGKDIKNNYRFKCCLDQLTNYYKA